MQLLFVHGMGRSPLSGWPLLRRLRQAGLQTSTFGYFASVEDFAAIAGRLASEIARVASMGAYVVVGHSLGGVLLRAALQALPADVRRPSHAFLLGSPMRPVRLAQRLGRNPAFRLLTRDCGQLLGSAERMAAIGPLTLPTTAIVGVRGLPFGASWFGGEPNDGVVAVSEVAADWLQDEVRVAVAHTWLPSSQRVAGIVARKLGLG